MTIKRFFQLMSATVILSSSIAVTPAHAEEPVTTRYPMVASTVFETIGDYLPMRDELADLQQHDPEIYNQLIWELYDISESYKITRIEAGLATADLYLQADLKDLETEWLAMEYMEAHATQNDPAVAEYEALQQAAEDLFDLETRIRDLENEEIWNKLTPDQRAELSRWEDSRLALKDELVQRSLDEYLIAEDELQFEMQWMGQH